MLLVAGVHVQSSVGRKSLHVLFAVVSLAVEMMFGRGHAPADQSCTLLAQCIPACGAVVPSEAIVAWIGLVHQQAVNCKKPCAASGVTAQAWQPLPMPAQPDDPVLPAEPPELLVLRCGRLLALAISAASRRMTRVPVSPAQRFELGVHDSHVYMGRIGGWVGKTCRRSFDRHDDRLATLRASHSCTLQSITLG